MAYKTDEDHDIHNQTGVQSSAVVADGVVYFGCRDSKVYALDAKTGAERWTFSNKGSWVIGTPLVSGDRMMSVGAVLSSPTVVGDTIYFGSTDGNLYALS